MLVKLLPEPDVAAELLLTLRKCNEASNLVAAHARAEGKYRKYDLHHSLYGQLKSLGFPAQLSVRAIGKAADAYTTLAANLRSGRYGRTGSPRRTRIENKPVVFSATAAQPFDRNCLTWNHEQGTVSIRAFSRRIRDIAFTGRSSDLALIAAHGKGETDLIYRDGSFYLAASVDTVPEPLNTAPAGFIGVDLGIVNIATTSDGDNWSGGAVTARRKKNVRLRSKLQAKGTKSAKRLLMKRTKKETRFVTDVNHRVSKRIVAEAKRTGRGIAVEDLTGIRARVRLRKPQRATIHSWAFAQLGAFLAYKAEAAGVPLVSVDPAYSSQECSGCGHVAKGNRPNQSTFSCIACGVSLNADVNAGKNLAHRGHLAWAAINLPHAA